MDRPVLEFVVVAEPQRDASPRAVLAELAASSEGAVVSEDARRVDWRHDGALYRASLAGEGRNGCEELVGCPCVLVRLDATECVVRTHLLPDENPMLALTIEDALSREGRAFEVWSEPDDASRASDAGEAKPAFPPLRAAGVSVPDRDPAGAARLVERVARLAARRLDAIRAVAARGTYV